MTDDSIERTLEIRRTFPAPRERVWRAFTDPDEFEAWFVPDGMTAEIHTFEIEPGGEVAFTWSDGEHEMRNEGRYVEVIKHERLVSVEEVGGREVRLTYEFHEAEGGTQVIVRQEFPDGVPEGADAGWHRILDQLDEVLAEP